MKRERESGDDKDWKEDRDNVFPWRSYFSVAEAEIDRYAQTIDALN